VRPRSELKPHVAETGPSSCRAFTTTQRTYSIKSHLLPRCNATGSSDRVGVSDSVRDRQVANVTSELFANTISGVRRTWKSLIEGRCGIVSVKDRSPIFATLPSQIAAIVPEGSREDGKWNAKEYGLSPSVSKAQ
jgi:hypothetical protein